MFSDQRSDRPVHAAAQRAFVVHVIRYGISCTLVVVSLLVLTRVALHPERSTVAHLEDVLWHLTPALVTALFVLPLLAYDVVRFSNRVVGPIHRVRVSLHDLAQGHAVQPLEFRKGDFWRELSEEFNAALRRIDQQREIEQAVETDDEGQQRPSSSESSE